MIEQEIECKGVKLDDKTLIKKWIFDDSDQIEIRPGWSGGYLTQTVNSWTFSGARGLKIFLKSFLIIFESYQPHPKDITRNFQNLIGKRFLRDIYWNPQNIGIVKCFFVSN